MISMRNNQREPLPRRRSGLVILAGWLVAGVTGGLAGGLLSTGLAAQTADGTDTLTTTSMLSSSDGSEATPWFRQTADHNKHALIITGAAASPEIRQRFRDWSQNLYGTLVEDYGYHHAHIWLLLDDGENVGQLTGEVRGSSRVEDVREAVNELAAQAGDGDQVTVFLIGHGSATFGEAKFNNVGPDMTGNEFANMLAVLDAQDLVIINTTSSSFEFSRELSALGRVVVSATRSPAERYDPRFGEYFITAMQGHRADLDRNGMVSVLEAFNYATGQVAEWYREQGRLATEHAVLDDNGDGMFSREPGRGQADGLLAEIAYLDVVRADEEKTSSEALALRSKMQSLEREVIILRNQKDDYLEQDYWNRLEALLVELALATRRYHALP